VYKTKYNQYLIVDSLEHITVIIENPSTVPRALFRVYYRLFSME